MNDLTDTEISDEHIAYSVSPNISNEQLNELFAASWPNHSQWNFRPVLSRSLAFICAFSSEHLVGFVYLAWDGAQHAFLLDTTVHPDFRRRGIGIELCRLAVQEASGRGVEWVHVDFEPHLREFYAKCGFVNTDAGLIRVGK